MKKAKRILSFLLVLCLLIGVVEPAFLGLKSYAAVTKLTMYPYIYPRSDDPAYADREKWGFSDMELMGGWNRDAFNKGVEVYVDEQTGQVVYCIEPGTSARQGDEFTDKGEDYWENYPRDKNVTLSVDQMRQFLGRVMLYGWQGEYSPSWRTNNAEDAANIADIIATQYIVWEVIVGERDAKFEKVDASKYGKDNVMDAISPEHTLYDEIMEAYNDIVAKVKKHVLRPSFMSATSASADTLQFKWNEQLNCYIAELVDENQVLDNYTFTSQTGGITFETEFNKLIVKANDSVDVTQKVSIVAQKKNCTSAGIVVWNDGVYGGGLQDNITTYGEVIEDPVSAYVNLVVAQGAVNVVKTSEDGNVKDIPFTITGEGVEITKLTDAEGKIEFSGLAPGTYTVAEQATELYKPLVSQTVTVVSGETTTVNFANELKRGDVEITKTSEDDKVKDVVFELSGTAANGEEVSLTAKTDEHGLVIFKDVLVGSYIIKEKNVSDHYVALPDKPVTVVYGETAKVTFHNELKKGNVQVTKTSDDEKVAGITFELSGMANSGKKITLTAKTNEQGVALFEDVPLGVFVVKELNVSGQYVDPGVQSVTVQADTTVEMAFHNKLRKTEVTVVKRLYAKEINFDNGNPTFVFKLQGADIIGKVYTYHQIVSFDESYVAENTDADGWVTKSVSFENVVTGYYSVTERNTSRYYLAGISDVQGGVAQGEGVVFDLVENEAGSAVFTNRNYDQRWFSDCHNITNVVDGKYIPSPPTHLYATEVDDRTITLNYIEGAEYSMDGVNWKSYYQFGGLNVVTEYTFYVRYRETKDSYASESISAKISTGKHTQEAPSGVTAKDVTDTSITLNSFDGAEYSMDGEIWQDSPTFTGLTRATEYVFYVRYKETADTYASESVSAIISTMKDTAQAPSELTVKEATLNSITLNAIDGAEYSRDGKVWQDSPTFTGLYDSTKYTFYARYKETATAYASKSVSMKAATLTILSYKNISTVGFTDSTTEFVIPASFTDAEGVVYHVVGVDSYAFWEKTALTEVVVPNTVTFIDDYAFCGCKNLKTVTFEENSALEMIGEQVFRETGITELEIPDSVTSIGKAAFYECDSLVSIVLPEGVTEVTEWMFGHCNNLSSVVIGNDVDTVGPYSFYNCDKLETVNLGNVRVVNEAAFYNCDGLVSIDLGNAAVIGKQAFYDCDGITELVIADRASSEGSIGDSAFFHCSALTGVVIGDSITAIGTEAFRACTALKTVEIGDGVTVIEKNTFRECSISTLTLGNSVEIIEDYAFYGNRVLSDLVLPDSVTTIGDYAFHHAGLKTVTIGSGLAEIGECAIQGNCRMDECGECPHTNHLEAFIVADDNPNYCSVGDVLYTKDMKTLICFPVGKDAGDFVIPDGVTTVAKDGLSFAMAVTSITIPATLTDLGTTGLSCFIGRDVLSTLPLLVLREIIVDENNPSYCSVDGVLYTKDMKTLVRYPIRREGASKDFVVPEGVTTIADYAFRYTYGTPSVTLADSVTTIGNYAFYNEEALDINNYEHVTTIGDFAFYNCDHFTDLTFSDNLTSIGIGAFARCINLKSVTIPNTVTYIGGGAFSGAGKLSAITLEDGNTEYCVVNGVLYTKDMKTLVSYPTGRNDTSFTVPEGVTTIAHGAFRSSFSYNENTPVGLRTVILPNSVTTIHNAAFYHCAALTSITIPASVTSIGDWAFYGCQSLTRNKIVFEGQQNAITFGENWHTQTEFIEV